MKRFFPLFIPVVCWAATTSVTVDQLIGMARSASGEFAAEALIRIAGIDKVEKPRRIALLEEAFGRAGEAQLPFRRRASITKVAGSAGSFNRIYAQGLDAMSLRLKAVDGMLPLDPQKARELFRRIPPVQLPRLTCDEHLVYDVDFFYDVLERLALQGFTPAEIEKGESFRLLQPYVAAVASPVQIPGAARLIAASNVSDKDFQSLMRDFARAMEKISGDDRSFTYAAAGPRIRVLMEAAQHRQISPVTLLEAYRAYIVNNMSAARCADDDLMVNEVISFAFPDARLLEEQGPDPALYFNGHLRMPPLSEIQEQEVTPSKLEGAASGLRGCDDDTCKAITRKYMDLIFDSTRNAYPMAHRETPEWQKQFRDFLDALAAWQPQGAAFRAEHFREKCALYGDLSRTPPSAADREMVLRTELDYVRKAKADAENRVQWFLAVNTLIGRVSLDPMGLAKLSADLRDTGDSIITLFAELETVAPRTPPQILPLF
jgi:hypothetical protein